MRIVTHSADETRAVGQRLAGVVQAGDLVLVGGDLGSGKTVLVQGLAQGLGVTQAVTSPTFTLVHEYDGNPPLLHADVYRLEHLAELDDLAIGEAFDGAAVTAVEWGDVVERALGVDHLDVRLDRGPLDGAADDRWVSIAPSGTSWNARSDAVTAALFDLEVL